MDESISVHYIIRKEALSSDDIRTFIHKLGFIPRSKVYLEPDSIETIEAFFSILPHEMIVNSVPLLMAGSLNQPDSRDEYLELPDEYCRITIWIPEGSLVGLPGQHDNLYEIMNSFFVGFKSEYAVSVHEEVMRVENMDWTDFRFLLGGVHILSKSLIRTLDTDELPRDVPHVCHLANGGISLRFQDEFFFGMPSEFKGSISSLLHKIWNSFE